MHQSIDHTDLLDPPSDFYCPHLGLIPSSAQLLSDSTLMTRVARDPSLCHQEVRTAPQHPLPIDLLGPPL